MGIWLLPGILSGVLLVCALILIFRIIKLKRVTEKTPNQNRADVNKLLRNRYKTVCIIAAVLAVILFVTAFVVLVLSKSVAVSMAMIMCAVIFAGVAGFCGGKILFSD